MLSTLSKRIFTQIFPRQTHMRGEYFEYCSCMHAHPVFKLFIAPPFGQNFRFVLRGLSGGRCDSRIRLYGLIF